jgi:hypothetical protein
MSVGSQHFGSSAKTGAGVNEIFRVLSERVIEHQSTKKKEEPKKRTNMRGALNVGGGLTDFNPDANFGSGGGMKLTRTTVAMEEEAKKKKSKGGCCK